MLRKIWGHLTSLFNSPVPLEVAMLIFIILMTAVLINHKIAITSINAVLERQQCQYYVKTVYYWKGPTTEPTTEVLSIPLMNQTLVEQQYDGAYDEAAGQSDLVDSAWVYLIEDCTFSADTLHKVPFYPCETCFEDTPQ